MGAELRSVIGTGSTATAYRLRDGDVAKVFVPETTATRVELERNRITVVSAAGADTPACNRTIARVSDGRLAIRMRVARGRMNARSRLHTTPWRARALVHDLAVCLAGVHGQAAPVELPRLEERSAERVMRCPHFSLAQRRQVLELLAELAAAEVPSRLCHGNFQIGNVIWEPGRCQAISWFNATAGDPAADLARAFVILRFRRSGFFGRRGNEMLADMLLEAYAAITGDDMQPRLKKWIVVQAVGRASEPLTRGQQVSLVGFATRLLDGFASRTQR